MGRFVYTCHHPITSPSSSTPRRPSLQPLPDCRLYPRWAVPLHALNAYVDFWGSNRPQYHGIGASLASIGGAAFLIKAAPGPQLIRNCTPRISPRIRVLRLVDCIPTFGIGLAAFCFPASQALLQVCPENFSPTTRHGMRLPSLLLAAALTHWLAAPYARLLALRLPAIYVLAASCRRCTPLHTTGMRLRLRLPPTRPPGAVSRRLLAPHALSCCLRPSRVVLALCTACPPSAGLAAWCAPTQPYPESHLFQLGQ
ncbi:hypothetical protein C8J57DRAFT_1509826 [Mycena rebaudengoi]|nr:hypothetical protein C8J57DRAFT_1509826 [Mycena rebaudengoi]